MPESPRETPIDDEQLALRAADGCLESFRLLVERYQVPLVRYLSRWTPRHHDAEDLAQETFVKAYRFLSRFDPQWRFSTWLFMIGRRLSINAARRRNPASTAAGGDGGQLEQLIDAQPEPAAQMASREGGSQLWNLAATVLTREQHDALWLFYVEGFSVAETAQVLDRSTMSVKSILFRARQQLRPHLASAAGTAPAADNLPLETSNSAEEWAHVRAYFTP